MMGEVMRDVSPLPTLPLKGGGDSMCGGRDFARPSPLEGEGGNAPALPEGGSTDSMHQC